MRLRRPGQVPCRSGVLVFLGFLEFGCGSDQSFSQNPHHFNRHFRKLCNHPEEHVFGNFQSRELRCRLNGGRPRNINQNGNFTDHIIFAQSGNCQWPRGRIDNDISTSGHNKIRRISVITLLTDQIAWLESQPFRSEGEQLDFDGSIFANKGICRRISTSSLRLIEDLL